LQSSSLALRWPIKHSHSKKNSENS
jgi:hypothetical protein